MSDLYDANMVKKNQSISVGEDEQGLCISIKTSQSTAKLSLFGGHLLSFVSKKDGRERIWVSEKAIFDAKTPIRGGVPICWPWFSAYSNHSIATNITTETASPKVNAPNHGFVRSQFWCLQTVNETYENELNSSSTKHVSSAPACTSVTLILVPKSLGMFGFSEKINVTLRIEVGEKLSIQVLTKNGSQESISITQALHTYFAVPDISDVVINGISTPYFDKLNNTLDNPCPAPYCITQEVDRVHAIKHLGYTQDQAIELASKNASKFTQNIVQLGHDSIVVWNPWQKLSMNMHDMADKGYQTMMCIEAANTEPVVLNPGDFHQLTQLIS